MPGQHFRAIRLYERRKATVSTLDAANRSGLRPPAAFSISALSGRKPTRWAITRRHILSASPATDVLAALTGADYPAMRPPARGVTNWPR